MIDNLDTNRIHDIMSRPSFGQPDSARPPFSYDIDVSLKVNYAYFINKATQIPQTDNDALQKACELLLSGRLEDTVNVKAAAENIVKYGI